MPSKLDLTIAVNSIDRTKPIITGAVEPEGIDPTVLVLETPERHRRMLKHAEFDVCEMSLGSYLASIDRAYPFTAIPVFPYRRFRYGSYFVNADSGIETPADLEGKRIGMRRWQNTAAVWMRGILEDRHGVDTTTVSWYIEDEDEVPVDVPGEFDVTRLSERDSCGDMLANGDLDALMYPARPRAFVEGDSRVKRLFPEFVRLDREYYRETNVFPLMHVIVVRDDVVAEEPWVPTSVRKAFERANRHAVTEFERLLDTRASFQWAAEAARAGSGDDPLDVLETEEKLWSSDVGDLREELETVVRYARRYGLLSTEPEPESLFIESSLERLPHTS